jgi:hypothetical protein
LTFFFRGLTADGKKSGLGAVDMSTPQAAFFFDGILETLILR